MKKHCLSFLMVLCLAFHAYGQAAANKRGIDPDENNTVQDDSGAVYALIVGVSQYADPQMPQLHYADSDAIYFYNFIRTGALGKTDSSKIHLLINTDVSEANFRTATFAITRSVKPGDKVYVFMAGHGDAANPELIYFLVNQTMRVHDADEYQAVQSIKMAEVVGNLKNMAVKHNVKTYLITDFCRSNELLGKDSLANYVFTNIMQTDVPGMTRMVSCNSNHVATEDDPENKKWNGHGVFTYYLVNGLLGLADKRNTGYVTLHDLQRYTTDNVEDDTRSTVDQNVFQSPVFVASNLQQKISKVNPKLKQAASLSLSGQSMNNEMAFLSNSPSASINYRSINNNIRDTVLLGRFLAALKQVHLVTPPGENAVSYLNKLLQTIKDENTRAGLTDLLVAALLNNGQKPIDYYSKNLMDATQLDFNYFNNASKYFEAALPYLKDNKAVYNHANASRLFLAARAMYELKEKKDLEKALLLADSALSIKQWAYIYHTRGLIYSNLGDMANAQKNEFLAMQAAPNWVYCINAIGSDFNDMKQYDSAEFYYRKAIQIDPKYFAAYDNMGANFRAEDKKDSAEIYYRKAISLNPQGSGLLWDLGDLFWARQQVDSAKFYCTKAFKTDTNNHDAANSLGMIFASQQKYDSAINYYARAIQIKPTDFVVYYNIAEVYSDLKDTSKAMHYLKLSIKYGFNQWDALKGDTDMDNIREQINSYLKESGIH